jgi:hypothetical protein
MNKNIVRKGTLLAVTELKKECPVGPSVPGDRFQKYRKGGQLRSSIGFEIATDRMSGKAGPSAKHAVFVVNRTRAHLIEPRTKKALYWVATGAGARYKRVGKRVVREGGAKASEWEGGVCTKRVRHPGTRANNFVKRAAQKVGTGLTSILAAEKATAMAGLGGE